MNPIKVGFLHPGAMGISLAAAAQKSGQFAYWASAGRSLETRARAQEHNLKEVQTVTEMCVICDVIVSICPPHAAADVADQVATARFSGLFVDANAIAPQQAAEIGETLAGSGVSFVDGSVIGGPAWHPGRTWLYLSGQRAAEVADCFANSPLETAVIGTEIGKASALKMCFAAYSKGSTALLCAILATADNLGVRADLESQWARGGSDFAEQAQTRVRRVTAKAWRFAGEMEEIAATFAAAGLPGGFHQSAHDIYQRLAHFKGAAEMPELNTVLAALQQPNQTEKRSPKK